MPKHCKSHRGETSWDNNETKNNFQSLIKRDYGNRTVSFSENLEGRNYLVVWNIT